MNEQEDDVPDLAPLRPRGRPARARVIRGANLLRYRQKQGLSSDELAAKLLLMGHKVTGRQVRRWEDNEHQPTAELAGAMATSLGCTVEDLARDEP